MPLLVLEERKYERYLHTKSERQTLERKGFKTVVSSNVSAIARDGDVLIVRFHGGATYGYPGSGELYDDMLNSSSKGKFVWNALRRRGVPYYKMANVNIPDDVESRDMMAGRPEEKQELGDTLLSALALGTMTTATDALLSGVVVSATLATLIDSRQAQNGRNK